MVEAGGDPLQVADAVTVAVLVRAGIHLVEDLAVPPVPVLGGFASSFVTAAQGSDDPQLPSAVVPIKYLGSKRRLVDVIGSLFTATGGGTALDLFTGTTRVAQELKRRGGFVTAVDRARYATVFAESAIATDASTLDLDALDAELAELDALPGTPGYVTETFCRQARFFRPENGARIDAIRDALERRRRRSALPGAAHEPDRGGGPSRLHDRGADGVPEGVGAACPPAPDAPPARPARRPRRRRAGRRGRVAAGARPATTSRTWTRRTTSTATRRTTTCGRRSWRGTRPSTTASPASAASWPTASAPSAFNRRRAMPEALRACIDGVDARTLVLSYNDESWLRARRAPRHVPGTRRGRDPRVRLQAVRGRADRHPRARRPAGRRGLASPQHRVPHRERRTRRGANAARVAAASPAVAAGAPT